MAKRLAAVIGAVAAVMGFLITQQIRTVSVLNQTAQAQEGKTLAALVGTAEKGNDAAQVRIQTLSTRLNTLGRAPNVEALKSQLAQTKAVAGMTPVSGPGVTVIMHDATKPAFPGEPAILQLIHDQYVLRVVALVSAAGAQAISIDGQRYIATTSIYCAGPTIRINNVPYASPYVIRAIGPVAAMLKALAQDPDIQGWSQLVSIKFHSDKRLEVAAYHGPVQSFVAKPVKIGG